MSNAAEQTGEVRTASPRAWQRWNSFVTVLRESRGPTTADDALPFLRTGRVVRAGSSLVVLFFLGFVGWAAMAPLQSAIVAPGTVIVESHRKQIQHLEGGIVKDILVQDGQMVKAGQPLIRLDNTQAAAALQQIQDEQDELTAQEARLTAERDGSPTIHFPPELLARANEPKVAESILGEQTAFENQKASIKQQVEILNEKKAEDARAIEGFQAQIAADDTQISLIQREADAVGKMVAKGLEPTAKLLDLQRAQADIEGQRGDLVQKIAQQKLDSGEDDIQIINMKSQALEDVLKDLRDVQSRRFDLTDRIQAARDVLQRTTLVAPVDGRVVDLQVHAKGAVVKAGEPVLEVIPVHDKLEIEARLRPQDADEVHAGMTAKVDLSAYKARRLPMLTGTVTYVSPDTLEDQHTGQPFFLVHVSVDRAILKDHPAARFIPGMPVQIEIQTGAHTALNYFLEPIRDVMHNGMREQ
ncbi:MAG TPA: HlyD family type I secretion periplasmic adaptor subunit [Rhizomicrobium sp.]|nr:HlyD family type I secretion periplasmic adaptor subunit [Rhizomicrobium sp.]